MGNTIQVGRVVWHDLFTQDIVKARCFYAALLDWEYRVEHATDFVWQPGEADYPLIFANGEAHGGFIDIREDLHPHWVAYVRVEDVDAVTVKAQRLGARIDRDPFNAPGVGRTSMIRDPQGAIICPHVPTHNFPPPSGTFSWEELITDDIESAKMFYHELFGWQAHDVDLSDTTRDRTAGYGTDSYTVFTCANETDAIGAIRPPFNPPDNTIPDNTIESPTWVTYLSTRDVSVTIAKAKTLGARVQVETYVSTVGRLAILVDPTGAIFGLRSAS